MFGGEVLGIFDERQPLELANDVLRQLSIYIPHAEVVVERPVSHPECFDEGLQDQRAVEFEGLEPVATMNLLRDERPEQLHLLDDPLPSIEQSPHESLHVQRWDLHRIPLVEPEHCVAVDLACEELVRGREL